MTTRSTTGRGRRGVLWRFRRTLFLLAMLVLAGVAGAGLVLAEVELPDVDPQLQSSFVCAADVVEGCGPDNAIAKLAGVEDRVSVPVGEMPQVFVEAVLAAEDRHFFSHRGIDPFGIARALYQDLRRDGTTQGGSTITQQYAKNAFLTSERTVTRKLKEAVLAVKLEREFSKEEILERYLNAVYFGRGAYGAEAAARAYFGVSVREVDLQQAAYLAGLIRAPESADASRDPETATFRRDSVLAGMLDEGWITADEHDRARAVGLVETVLPRTDRDGMTMLGGAPAGAEYYLDYVRRLLYDTYGADVVNGGGLRVYVALDTTLQAAAHEAVWGFLDQPGDPAGALVSIDEAGRVVALVGGEDFETSQVNLALGNLGGGSGRQAGSTFKPVVLATALEQGISVDSRFTDQDEIVIPRADAGEDWTVANYTASGTSEIIDLVEATRRSSNTVYAQLMREVGPLGVVQMAEKLGVRTDLAAVNSLVLGSGEVSVLDMAAAYSTFSRRGRAVEPVFVTRVEQVVDGETRVLETTTPEVSEPIATGTADQVNAVLREVVLAGTGRGADPGVPAAGKTGTTDNYRDAWFVGYTPRLTTAVWMGFVDSEETGDGRRVVPAMTDVRGTRVTGGSFPATIWRRFMQAALAGTSHGSFAPPPPSGGRILNQGLTTTTTAPPPCPAPGDESAEPTSTTAPCTPVSTTTSPTASTSTTSATASTSTTTSTTPSTSTTTTSPTSGSTTAPSTSLIPDPLPGPDG